MSVSFCNVHTRKHRWFPDINKLNDYMRYENSTITDVAIKVDNGLINYLGLLLTKILMVIE